MGKTVLIDPGHGGGNFGCVYQGMIEKTITLDLANRLVDLLAAIPDITPVRTRDSDVFTDFAQRGAVEAARRPNFVISIHVNASRDVRAHGAEGYFWPGNAAGQVAANEFVSASRGRVIQAVDPHPDEKGDWIEHPRAVLGAFKAPSVLCECYYLSNYDDRMLLTYCLDEIALRLRDAALAGLDAVLEDVTKP